MDTNKQYWTNSIELARQFVAAEREMDEIEIVQIKLRLDELIRTLVLREEVR